MPKIEIKLTKTQIDKLRRLTGYQTKTKPELVLKSLVTMLIDNPTQLETIKYETQRP